MNRTLASPAFASTAAVKAVVTPLAARGGEDAVRFVGGCVRDWVMGRPIGDIDIATTLRPDAVTAALEGAGLKVVPTGLAHGTVTAVYDGAPFEITTLRRDVETDGRRAVVSFTEDWAEDAARRDFTLNALYLDLAGDIHDPTGAGLVDAHAGRIRFVGDPRQRIMEDGLRILRFFRFLAWFGKGPPDPEALGACAEGRDGLKRLSAERISRELLKLLGAEDPLPALDLMAEAGVLERVVPAFDGLERIRGLVGVDNEVLFTCDPVLRLAALLPRAPLAAAAAARGLRLANAVVDRIAAAGGEEPRIVSWLSPREIRRALYRLGPSVFKDRVRLAWAADPRPAAATQWRTLLVFAETWTPPTFPLTGAQILKAGVPPGPLVGAVRREVEDWWVDLDFPDDALAMLERLKAVAQGLAY
jgi:poly(A) polymerase